MPLFWIKDFNQFDARYQKLVSSGGEFGLLLQNHKLTNFPSSLPPTLAAGANNTGTGIVFGGGGVGPLSDFAGAIQFTAGSTATPGAQVRVTFRGGAMIGDYMVMLQMHTSVGAATAGLYPLNRLTTSFDIGFTAVTPGATYTVAYFIVQFG